MKRIPLFSLLVTFALLAIGLWIYYPTILGSDWEAEVPPRVNTDGTIDYVLMQKSHKVEGHYWIMRLPKEIYVERSENRSLGQFSTGGVSASLKETANSNFIVYLFKDSLRPAVLKDKISSEDTLSLTKIYKVYFQSWYVFDAGSGPLLNAYAACREELSASPRVRIFSYDEEIEKAHAPKKCQHIRPFAHENWTTKGYVITDSDGKHIGDFECTSYPNEPTKKCTGFVNLGENNQAQLGVNESEIDPQKLATLADAVREFAKQHLLERGTLAINQKYKFK